MPGLAAAPEFPRGPSFRGAGRRPWRDLPAAPAQGADGTA